VRHDEVLKTDRNRSSAPSNGRAGSLGESTLSNQSKGEKMMFLTFRGLFVVLACFFGSAAAQAPALLTGPYYATPAWDQTLASSTRFLILIGFSNQAVLDRETGLVWQRSPDTAPTTWLNARSGCINKSVGAVQRKGWRLPSINELASLLDPNHSSPALPPNHPFLNVQSAIYWSATTYTPTSAGEPPLAWAVELNTGGVGFESKENENRVWCVRGAGVLANY
jgi:hypothetical protein